MAMTRRGFMQLVLGAGAALYVPTTTYFLLGDPEKRVLALPEAEPTRVWLHIDKLAVSPSQLARVRLEAAAELAYLATERGRILDGEPQEQVLMSWGAHGNAVGGQSIRFRQAYFLPTQAAA